MLWWYCSCVCREDWKDWSEEERAEKICRAIEHLVADVSHSIPSCQLFIPFVLVVACLICEGTSWLLEHYGYPNLPLLLLLSLHHYDIIPSREKTSWTILRISRRRFYWRMLLTGNSTRCSWQLPAHTWYVRHLQVECRACILTYERDVKS